MTVFVPSRAGEFRSKVFFYGSSLEKIDMVCANVPVTQPFMDLVKQTANIAVKVAFDKSWQELFNNPTKIAHRAEKRGFEIVADNYLVEFQSGDA